MSNRAIITKAALLIGVLITAGCSDTTPLSPPPDTDADNTIAENCTADNYIGANAFSIGPLLSGTAWEGDTITLAIPEGKTLDDFDSISVWCFDFNANFGDAFFGDV